MMFACFALTMLVALLGVPAIKERFDANHGVFWENGMRGSSLFLAGILLPPLFWIIFPFWGIVFDMGGVVMGLLFTLLALACIALVSVGTWNGRRRWGSAACVTYGTVLGVAMPWAIWAQPNLQQGVFFEHLCGIVIWSLLGLSVIAAATVRFRCG
ncbi:hypothetical protein FRX94_11360 [Corynebacterium canis]|uniref:Uncharacterized protein n=1 Tax=Corynebacterium canis TaxID=679663 RepID=A0A5C5U5Z1_9CORY|nr:hypothetical protein [Corynebacterium canis]TWT21032.1 hypothetical protein FRX94_11360 [Corynebacterium canis]WJY74569.1 hypothetical protein CCANI_03565 [Corynebacterium canis]